MRRGGFGGYGAVCRQLRISNSELTQNTALGLWITGKNNPFCLQIARQRTISGSASSASITPVDHPSRTQARSPALHPRNPKNAAQNSQSSNFMAKRPPAAPTVGGGFATSTAA